MILAMNKETAPSSVGTTKKQGTHRLKWKMKGVSAGIDEANAK
jgi:hypothetical protein